ncbi:MAG: hypothetical protein WBQ10_14015 [Terriglobales bacterium]
MNYLLNLGFSLAAKSAGNFQPDNSNTNPLLRSAVWLSGGALLPPLQDSFYQILSPLTQTDWTFVQEASNALQVYANQGYNLLVRVFQADTPTSTSYKLMLNAVFGQGSTSEPSSAGVQSPLMVNGLPRSVVDSLQLAFANPQQQQPYWSAPASDGAWTYCMGTIHGSDNTYSFNAGASVCTNPSTGSPIYQYAIDPRVKVGMGFGRKHEKAA